MPTYEELVAVGAKAGGTASTPPPIAMSYEDLVKMGAKPGATKGVSGSWDGPPAPSWIDRAAGWLPAIGGTVGGIVGSGAGAAAGGVGAVPIGIGGAALGGAAGEAASQLVKRTFGNTATPETSTEAAGDIGWEGLKQGAYEGVGRALIGLGGRALGAAGAVKVPFAGSTIAGVEIPETVGQVTGKAGGLVRKAEHYLSGTWVGGSLRVVRSAQEDATRKILAKLATSAAPGTATVPEDLAANWAKARETTRIAAGPIYDSLKTIPAPGTAKVASDILNDSALRLSSKARTALSAIATTPEDEAAKLLGFNDAQTAIAKVGQKAFNVTMQKFQSQGLLTAPGATVGDALAARHELGDLASSARDPADRRLFGEAQSKLNASIETHLDPAQIAAKKEADLLWRRSYIMDRMSRGFERMTRSQDPNAVATVLPNSFTQMVNRLAEERITRDSAGNIVKKASDLSLLFPDAADQKAIVDLASLLKTKYANLRGGANLGDYIVNIGTVFEAGRAIKDIATGDVKGAASNGAYLAGLYALSAALANPGGARLALDYFKAPASAIAPAAIRLISQVTGTKEPTSATPPPVP